ncbi:hypothetical protein BKG82_27000 [Mycobacteroides chelonae]|uniref:Uncharacterized protein n=1 Tax=Mycobacteroides chelonae TaxID=1774 RepID=A0A1S1LJ10_MYCCH|nr:hypothetical protein [Mycobacteroides chelonae]OHU47302.1 hypothetical protein BKG82_27000 [Mycobacteroides chelonae]
MILTVAIYLNDAPESRALDLSIAQFRKAVTFDVMVPAGEFWGEMYQLREMVFEQLTVDAPEQEWARRYRAAGNRSFAIGDAVNVGQQTWIVTPSGWYEVFPREFIPMVPAAQRLWWMTPLLSGQPQMITHVGPTAVAPAETNMAPLLIGGAARVGKTTLARRLVQQCPSELVHLDHLLHALKTVAAQQTLNALRKAPSINTNTPHQWLSELRERDRALWAAAREHVNAARGEPIIVEGGLWPDWLPELEQDHTAIFIVDTGDSADRLVDIAEANPQSWMAQRKWSEEKIRRWASYNRFRSEMIADLAAAHDYPVFDVAGGIELVQDRALNHLIDHVIGKGNQMSNEPPDSNPMTWNHPIKGLITGHVVWQDDTWAKIKLVGDHKLRYGARRNRGRVDEDGAVLTLRRSRLHPVSTGEPSTPQ